jgi:hypothetical protein
MQSEAEREHQVIRISFEVAQGAARYRAAVRAQSIERALEIMGKQDPVREAEVALPIDHESSSVRGAITTAGATGRKAA